MRNNAKLWLVSIAVAVVLVGGAYLVGSSVARAQMGMQPATIQTDPMVRIAVALERIASALEKSASSPMGGMASSMMQGMGQMSMMSDMSKMMEQMQQRMQQCQEMMDQMRDMMQGMQGMMGSPMTGRSPAAQPPPAQPTVPAQAPALTEADLTRTSQAAGITVAVTFMNPLLKPEEVNGKLVFKVALDTHTVDLSQFDLTKLAVLRTSEGKVIADGFSWEPESESSHHRSGLLKLAATTEGTLLITPGTNYIELELKEIGVPSRLFKWEREYLTSSKV
jgi:hypothetical protein